MGEQNGDKTYRLYINGIECGEVGSIHSCPIISFSTEDVVDVDITNICSPSEKSTDITSLYNQSESVGLRLKPSKRNRATNRKRFIKLCMADGDSRNSANALAKGIRAAGYSYKNFYFSISICAEMFKSSVSARQRVVEPSSAERR